MRPGQDPDGNAQPRETSSPREGVSASVSDFRLALEETPDGVLLVRIIVDGERFGEDCVDLNELWSSASTSGGHDILTCGCGLPECAGFWDPVFVSHDGTHVTWDFDRRYHPIPEKEETDERIVGKLVFERKEYVLELRGLFACLESDPRRGKLGPYGFDFEFLSSPSPGIDELRTPFPKGSSITVGYSRDFREPHIKIDGERFVSMKKLVPTMSANLALEAWQSMWRENEGSDEESPVNGLHFLKPEFSLDGCNAAAKAAAESLKGYWKDAAIVRWQRIESISPWRAVSECVG